jgi:hypothetical protein
MQATKQTPRRVKPVLQPTPEQVFAAAVQTVLHDITGTMDTC